MVAKRIIQYTLKFPGTVYLEMPENSLIISSDIIGTSIILWALGPASALDDKGKLGTIVTRNFIIAETNQMINYDDEKEELQFISSFQTSIGKIIHLFEIVNF